jgi:hypothetical protein
LKWVRRFLIAGWFIGMVVLTVWYGLDLGATADGIAPLGLTPMMHTDTTHQMWYDYMGWIQGCSGRPDCEAKPNAAATVETTPLTDEHAYSRDTKAIRIVPHVLTP